jgi:hypothetical protein
MLQFVSFNELSMVGFYGRWKGEALFEGVFAVDRCLGWQLRVKSQSTTLCGFDHQRKDNISIGGLWCLAQVLEEGIGK